MFKVLKLGAMAPALAALGLAPAFAEIADVDVKPGGFYVSVEGGSETAALPSVAAHGMIVGKQSKDAGSAAGAFAAGVDSSRAVAIANVQTVARSGSADAFAAAAGTPPFAIAGAVSNGVTQAASAYGGNYIKADDGAFAGFSAGHVFLRPLLDIFQRFEVSAGFGGASASERVVGAASGMSVDARTAFASVSQGPDFAVASAVKQEIEQDEVIFRLKTRSTQSFAPFSLLVSVEPFYRRFDQDTRMTAHMPLAIAGFPIDAFRNATVSADYYGAQLALEASYHIAPRMTWIGRAAAGGYILESNGRFRDNFGVTRLIDDSVYSGGLRTGAETGLRFQLTPSSWLSVTGSIDYFSDAPTAVLPCYPTERPAHSGLDDVTDYRATARLTFAIY
jgi:hypothetical protein